MEATEQENLDQEIFDQATADTPPAEAPVEAPTEAKAERVRDDKGRFVTAEPVSQEATEAEPQPEAEKESDARVPSWRLAEEAERRRGAEQALNELRNEFRQMQMQMLQQRQPVQPQQEPPDIFADPNGFVQNLQQNFDNRLRDLRNENSLRFAHHAHGEKFEQAYHAFTNHVTQNRDAQSYQRVMQAGDPGEEIVKWYRDQELHTQLGNSDLPTFLDKQREEWLKDPAVQAKVIEAFKATQQAQPSNTLTSLPPSLSRATAAAPAHDSGGAGGSDIYSYAIAKR